MKLSEMYPADREKLNGKTVMFEVFRNGDWSPRYGTVSRMKKDTFFVGAYVYGVGEVRNVREVE